MNVAGPSVTITVPAGVQINDNSASSVMFSTGAGLFNGTISQIYMLTVHTSTETTPVTSNGYTINPAPVTTATATVIPNPGIQSVLAKYTISFITGGLGAL